MKFMLTTKRTKEAKKNSANFLKFFFSPDFLISANNIMTPPGAKIPVIAAFRGKSSPTTNM